MHDHGMPTWRKMYSILITHDAGFELQRSSFELSALIAWDDFSFSGEGSGPGFCVQAWTRSRTICRTLRQYSEDELRFEARHHVIPERSHFLMAIVTQIVHERPHMLTAAQGTSVGMAESKEKAACMAQMQEA